MCYMFAASSPPLISVFNINSPINEGSFLVSGPVVSGTSQNDIVYYKDGEEVGVCIL